MSNRVPDSSPRSAPPHAFAGKGDLTSGPVAGHLVRLSVPMIWGIFAIVSFQLVDTWYVSLLGTTYLAAMTFTFPITFIIFNLTMSQGVAMSSVLSRQIGERRWTRVRRIVPHGIILTLLIGIVLAALGILTIDPLFRALGAGADTLPLIRDYMMIWFVGSIFIAVPMVGNSAIRATGDTFTPAMIMTVAALANAVLDPIMIFGMFGFPRMEMQGAALATLIANFAAMIAGFYVLHVRKKLICTNPRHMKLFADSVRRILTVAVPVGVTSIIQPLTNAVIIALLAAYGAASVAAFGIALRVEAFAFVIIMALATGASPIIGQNWGAKRIDRVTETLRKGFGFAIAWSLFISLILLLFGKPIAGLFSDQPEVVGMTALYFYTVSLTYAAVNLIPGWTSAFNAMGHPKRSLMILFTKQVLLTVPAVWIGGAMYGGPGIFIAIALVSFFSGLGFHVLNRRFYRRLCV